MCSIILEKSIFTGHCIPNFLYEIRIEREIEGLTVKLQSKHFQFRKINYISYFRSHFYKNRNENRKYENQTSQSNDAKNEANGDGRRMKESLR